MKTMVRGPFSRTMSVVLLLLFLIPSILITIATVGSAMVGGTNRIYLLPVNSSASGAPANVTAKVQKQILASLAQQPGLEVSVLNQNQSALKNAAGTDATEKAALLSDYDIAVDSKSSDEDRTKAISHLLDKLNVDAIIYCNVDRFEVTSKPGAAKIRLLSRVYTLETNSLGKRVIGIDGNVKPLITPVEAIGHSKDLPNIQASPDIMLDQAVADASDSFTQQIIQILQGTEPSGTHTAPVIKKKSSNWWLWALGAGLIVAGVSGGGKSDKTPPVPPVLMPAINLRTNVYSKPNSGGQMYVLLRWTVPTGANPTSFVIYRDVTAGMVSRSNSVLGLPGLKTLPGHPLIAGTRTRSLTNATPRSARQLPDLTAVSGEVYATVGGTVRSFEDDNVSVGHTYTYFVVAMYGTQASEAAGPIVAVLQASSFAAQNVTAVAKDGTTRLNWTAPTGIQLKAFRIYRAVGLVGMTIATNDDLAQFTQISQDSLLPATATTYLDTSPIQGRTNFYVVVPIDMNGNVTAGPHTVVQANISTIPTVALSAVSAVTSAITQRIYYSLAPPDQISGTVGLSTDVTFTATATSGNQSDASGAMVTLKTNIGSFLPTSESQILLDDKTIRGTLDAAGNITVTYRGRADDAARTTYLPPTINEVGTPTFTCVNTVRVNNTNTTVTIPVTGTTLPVLVGPPNSILLSWVVPASPVAQPNSFDVLFQIDAMTLTADVKDISGQTVLAGMPIWFTQSWTPLTTQARGTQEYFDASMGPGNIGTPVPFTDVNGRVVVGYRSNHSGLFTIYAYALRKNVDTQLLTTVSNSPLGGRTAANFATVQQYMLPLHTNSGYVFAQMNLVTKTFPFYSNWQKISVSQTRLDCSDRFNSATVKFYADDYEGKRVLPGSYYKLTPFMILYDGKLQYKNNPGFGDTEGNVARIFKTTNVEYDPAASGEDGYLTFDEQSVTSFLVTGNKYIGELYLEFNGITNVQNVFHTPDPIVTMYGPSLDQAVQNRARVWPEIIPTEPYKNGDTVDPNVDGILNVARFQKGTTEGKDKSGITYLCYQSTEGIDDNAHITIRLEDNNGNKFPAGYQVVISGDGYGQQNGITDTNGECMMPDLFIPGANGPGGTDRRLITLLATVYGENKNSKDVRSTDTSLNTFNYESLLMDPNDAVIDVRQPNSGNPLNTISLGGNVVTSSDIVAYQVGTTNILLSTQFFFQDDTGNTQGITYNLVKFAAINLLPATLTATITTIPMKGPTNVLNGTLSFGSTSGSCKIIAYYDANNDGLASPGEILVTSPTIYVGADPPAAPVLTALSATSVRVQWGNVFLNSGYVVERQVAGGAWFPIILMQGPNGAPMTVGKDVTSYVDTGLIPNTQYSYQIRTVNIGGVTSANPSTVTNVTTWPDPDLILLIPTVVSATEIDLSWSAITNITNYILQRGLTQNGPWTSIPVSAITYKDTGLTTATKYYYRLIPLTAGNVQTTPSAVVSATTQ